MLEPSYLALHRSGELRERAQQALELLRGPSCEVCPRICKVDRLADERGLCRIGRNAIVASHFPHFGEENCLRGVRGSGTIFFSGCNLRCVFCQNFDVSWQVQGEEASAERLAGMMLELQAIGCHNINWVTPEHVVPQILEALPLAVDRGLRLPTVYNTSAYDSPGSLALMDGVVDVYMPDLKLMSRDAARRYVGKREYADVARANVKEMKRQELGPGTYVNLMGQFYPAGKVGDERYEEINRRPTGEELAEAFRIADDLGLMRLDSRSRRAALAGV